ncbi:MAG TPA: hypothetical protein VL400_10375, partial [Polyangiaceae bacterium]|nr:hypothetical protein [Polyangiaceae bacterium]
VAVAVALGLGLGCADELSTTAGQGGQGGVLTGVGSTATSTGTTSSTASSQGGAGQGGAGGAGQGGAFDVDVHTSLDPNAGLVLTTALPKDVAACRAIPGAPCADLDGDGLVDAWESIVLERMRPIQRLDEDEQLVNDPAFVLGDVGRVAPVNGLVHVFIMLGYEKDYGSCGGFTGHNGDSERVALELEAVPGGGPGDVRVKRLYTAAHEGTTADHSRLFATSELSGLAYDADPATGEPRWVVFPSSDKHGTYATIDICEGISVIPCFDEDCAPDGVANPADYDRLPPFVNAGEETMPLVSDLTALGFPGDDAWAVQDFCGGLGGTGCSDDVRNKLLNDPF